MLKLTAVVVASIMYIGGGSVAAVADMALDNVPDDVEYRHMHVEIVEDNDKEFCITIEEEHTVPPLTVWCYAKPGVEL